MSHKINETKQFRDHYEAIRSKSPRVAEFLEGVRFILERDPSAGYHWGRGIWCLSSVHSPNLPLATIFYSFSAQEIRLLDIIEVVLM